MINIHDQYEYNNIAAILNKMTSRLSHRGPDDSGFWLDKETGVALGHRRLSIVDLSPMGHQPLLSHSGRYVLVYNGEIYNFMQLRKELEHSRVVFRGHSDTEVLLAAIENWGIISAVNKFVGMFAFAIWDTKERIIQKWTLKSGQVDKCIFC